MASDSVKKTAQDAAAWLVASVMGSKKEGFEGSLAQFMSGLIASFEGMGMRPPALTDHHLKAVAFELLSFASFHAALLAGQRDELDKDQQVQFAVALVNSVGERTSDLGGDLHERVREYWACADADALLLRFKINLGSAALPLGSGGYLFAEIYCGEEAPNFPKLAKILLDCTFG